MKSILCQDGVEIKWAYLFVAGWFLLCIVFRNRWIKCCRTHGGKKPILFESQHDFLQPLRRMERKIKVLDFCLDLLLGGNGIEHSNTCLCALVLGKEKVRSAYDPSTQVGKISNPVFV